MRKLLDLELESVDVREFPALLKIFKFLQSRGLGIMESENTNGNYKNDLCFIEGFLKKGEIGRALDKIFGEGKRTLVVEDTERFVSSSRIIFEKMKSYTDFLAACKKIGFIHTSGLFFFDPFYELDNKNNEDMKLVSNQSNELEVQVLFMGKEDIENYANKLFVKFMVYESEGINRSIKEIVNMLYPENNKPWPYER